MYFPSKIFDAYRVALAHDVLGKLFCSMEKCLSVIEIQLVRLTEVCGKVLSEKNAYKSVKTAALLSNSVDADHQNSRLFWVTLFFTCVFCDHDQNTNPMHSVIWPLEYSKWIYLHQRPYIIETMHS